jgi:hypothetical protein
MRFLFFFVLLIPLIAKASAINTNKSLQIINECGAGGCKIQCLIEPVDSRNKLALEPNAIIGAKDVIEIYFSNGSRALYFQKDNKLEKLLLSETIYCHIENIKKMSAK